MLIKDVIGYDTYQFNQYIHELAACLQNDTQTLILCNLLNKYCNYSNGELQIHKNGKQYHFFHSQKDIYTTELCITRKKFEKAIKCLKEKGYIDSFSAKQPGNQLNEITYFYINVDKIKETFEQGYRIIHKTEPKQSTKKQSNNASKLTKQQKEALAVLSKKLKANVIDKYMYDKEVNRILNNNVK